MGEPVALEPIVSNVPAETISKQKESSTPIKQLVRFGAELTGASADIIDIPEDSILEITWLNISLLSGNAGLSEFFLFHSKESSALMYMALDHAEHNISQTSFPPLSFIARSGKLSIQTVFAGPGLNLFSLQGQGYLIRKSELSTKSNIFF